MILVDGLLAEGHSVNDIEVMGEALDEARREFFKTGEMQYEGFDPTKTPSFLSTPSGQCQGITKVGNQCTRNADSGSIFCWQHK